MDHRVSDHSVSDLGARLRIGVVALIVAAALAGCGRKGPLELPPSTAQTQAPTPAPSQTAAQPANPAEAQATRVQPVTDDPALIQPPGTYVKQERSAATSTLQGPINAPTPPKPGKPFILDPLL